MYLEPTTKTYVESDNTKVSISDNTDFSISGTSKKFVFANGLNEYVTVGFDTIDLSEYEEFCIYLYNTPTFGTDEIISIKLDGNDYEIKQVNRNGRFQFVVIDCADLGTVSEFRITSLTANLTVFMDFPIVRKATTDSIDLDILQAIASQVSLNYNVSTTLSASVLHGDRDIELASNAYVFNNSKLRITNGATTEEVTLDSRDGQLAGRLTNSYPVGATIDVLCPVKYGISSEIINDPVCGIVITDKDVEKSDEVVIMTGTGSKVKRVLGGLVVSMYVECSSEKKALDLSRQLEEAFGQEFELMLDGERVDIFMVDNAFIGEDVGGLARASYTYSIIPQGLTLRVIKKIVTLNLTLESEAYESSI